MSRVKYELDHIWITRFMQYENWSWQVKLSQFWLGYFLSDPTYPFDGFIHDPNTHLLYSYKQKIATHFIILFLTYLLNSGMHVCICICTCIKWKKKSSWACVQVIEHMKIWTRRGKGPPPSHHPPRSHQPQERVDIQDPTFVRHVCTHRCPALPHLSSKVPDKDTTGHHPKSKKWKTKESNQIKLNAWKKNKLNLYIENRKFKGLISHCLVHMENMATIRFPAPIWGHICTIIRCFYHPPSPPNWWV